MVSIKYILKFIWVYIETRFTKFLRWFGWKYDSSEIPTGHYCYSWDEEKNIKEPCDDGGYWIKTCKYYRYMKGQGYAGCTYIGFMGWDPWLGDQCKACGENLDFPE